MDSIRLSFSYDRNLGLTTTTSRLWCSRPLNAAELLVPSLAFPLVTILEQPFLNSVRALVLTGSMVVPSFGLPSTKAHSYMPNLDDLRVDDFNLGGSVQITSEGRA